MTKVHTLTNRLADLKIKDWTDSYAGLLGFLTAVQLADEHLRQIPIVGGIIAQFTKRN